MNDTTSFATCGRSIQFLQREKRLSLYSRIKDLEKRLNESDEFFIENTKSAKIAENKLKNIKLNISENLVTLNEKTNIIDIMISKISAKDLNSYVISQISAMEKSGSLKDLSVASEFRQSNLKFQKLIKRMSNEIANSSRNGSDSFETIENLVFRIKRAQDEQELIIQKYLSSSKF